MIDLKDAINIIRSGAWVNLAYVSFDSRTGEAGRIIRLPRCRWSRDTKNDNTLDQFSRTGINPEGSKAQNHNKHFTVNMKTQSGQIRKLHLRLLFMINNQKIL